tara:strand:+ start:1534 stop:1797 length:264 start_codon:yes stop_codon:yes gene_type:complete
MAGYRAISKIEKDCKKLHNKLTEAGIVGFSSDTYYEMHQLQYSRSVIRDHLKLMAKERARLKNVYKKYEKLLTKDELDSKKGKLVYE